MNLYRVASVYVRTTLVVRTVRIIIVSSITIVDLVAIFSVTATAIATTHRKISTMISSASITGGVMCCISACLSDADFLSIS